MNCEPNSLLGGANCFRCIPPARQRATAIYLLCRWANGGQPTPPPTGPCFPPECAVNYPDSIDMVGAGDPTFDGNYQFSGLDGGGNPTYSLGGAPYGTAPYIAYTLLWTLTDPTSGTSYAAIPESEGSPFVLFPVTAVAPAPIGSPNYAVTPGCDPVVRAWLGNILLDPTAVPPPQDVIDAVCELVKDLRDGAILDKILVLNPAIPPTDGTQGSLTAMMYPLVWQNGNTFIPFTPNVFTIANLNINGLLGDHINEAYANTGFICFNHWGAANDSGGVTVYESEASTEVPPETECDIGVIDITDSEFLILEPFNVWDPFAFFSGYEGVCWDGVPGTGVVFGNRGDIPAFYSLNRTTTQLLELTYENSGTALTLIDQAVNDASGDVLPDIYPVVWFMLNWHGPPMRFASSKRMSFMAIHEGLTQAEVHILFNAVQTFRQTLGGGWV